MAEKYGTDGEDWLSKSPKFSFGRSVWKGIMKCRNIFRNNIKFKVNKGTKIRFWFDNWLLSSPLYEVFPNLFNISRKKKCFVSDCFIENAGVVNWDFGVPTRVNSNVRTELIWLQRELDNVKVNIEEEDVLEWQLSNKNIFSIKSTYDQLANEDLEAPVQHIFNQIWKLKVPPKIGFFLWTIEHSKLPTGDMLRSR